jgi:hypothetical protein
MNYYSFMFYSTGPRMYALKLQSELKIDLRFWQLEAFSVLLNFCRRGYWAAFKFCNGTYCTPVFSTNVRLFGNDKKTLTYSAGAPIIAKNIFHFLHCPIWIFPFFLSLFWEIFIFPQRFLFFSLFTLTQAWLTWISISCLYISVWVFTDCSAIILR